MDGCQGWVDDGSELHVIEADKRHIVRNADAALAGGFEDAKRQCIVARENSRDAGVLAEKLARHHVAAGERVAAVQHAHGRVFRGFADRLQKAFGALRKVAMMARAGQMGQMAVPERDQVFGGQAPAALVVGANGGERNFFGAAVEQEQSGRR